MALNTGGGGGGGSAGGIKAGLAYVELVAKDKIGPVLDKLRGRFAGIGSALTKAGAAGAAAGAAVLAPVVALATAGAERFDRINAEADRLRLPIDEFYRLATAAEIAGVSIEQVADNPLKYADLFPAESPVEDIKAAVEATREWRKTLIALKEAGAGVLTDLVPLLKAVGLFVRENRAVVGVAAVAGVVLAGLGTAGILLGGAFSLAAAAVAAFKVALLFLLSPVGAVVAAVAALGYAIATQTDIGKGAVGELTGLFRGMGETFNEAWGGIVAAVKKGDMEGAFKVAAAGIKVIWYEMVEYLRRQWDTFRDGVIAGAKMIVAGLAPVAGLVGITPPAALAEFRTAIGGGGGPSAELTAVRAELEAARRQLRAAVEAAKWEGPGGRSPSIGDPVTPAMMARVRGTFSGPLGQQLGAGTSFQRDMLAGVRRTNDLLKSIADAIGGAGALVFK